MTNRQTKEQILSAYKNFTLSEDFPKSFQTDSKPPKEPSQIKLNGNGNGNGNGMKDMTDGQKDSLFLKKVLMSNRRALTQGDEKKIKKYVSLYGKGIKSSKQTDGKRVNSIDCIKKPDTRQSNTTNLTIKDLEFFTNSKRAKHLSQFTRIGNSSYTPSSRPISSFAQQSRITTPSSQSSSTMHQKQMS